MESAGSPDGYVDTSVPGISLDLVRNCYGSRANSVILTYRVDAIVNK